MDPTIVGAIIGAVGAIVAAGVGLIQLNKAKRTFDLSKHEGRHKLDEPVLITAKNQNRCRVESDFLLWSQCTILIWVYVPPKGEGLRNSPSNKYIFGHITGTADEQNYLYYNQFCLRHSSPRGRWEVQFSNEKAKYPDKYLVIGDGLATGWHQFVITWDSHAEKIAFMIDAGKNGSDLSNSYIDYWPSKVGYNVTVGGWAIDWDGHFCETQLGHLWIAKKYSEATSEIVKAHYDLGKSL